MTSIGTPDDLKYRRVTLYLFVTALSGGAWSCIMRQQRKITMYFSMLMDERGIRCEIFSHIGNSLAKYVLRGTLS